MVIGFVTDAQFQKDVWIVTFLRKHLWRRMGYIVILNYQNSRGNSKVTLLLRPIAHFSLMIIFRSYIYIYIFFYIDKYGVGVYDDIQSLINELLLVYNHFRGVKNFHLLFGAIRLLEYILLIVEQIAWVSRWFVLKKIYCQNVFVPLLTEFITLQRLHNYVDMIQSMNGIVCWYNLLCFENNMTKKSNLMILDNSGRLFTNVIIRAWFSCLLENWTKLSRLWQHLVYDLITNRSRQTCQKNKMWRQRQQFLRFYNNK